MFDQASAKAVLAIPLARRSSTEILFWGHNKNGIYSVGSGYWLGMVGSDDNNLSRNAAVMNRKMWDNVWTVKGPPKLKHFL